MRGLEPPTSGSTVQCSDQLSYTHHNNEGMKIFASNSDKVKKDGKLIPLHHGQILNDNRVSTTVKPLNILAGELNHKGKAPFIVFRLGLIHLGNPANFF